MDKERISDIIVRVGTEYQTGWTLRLWWNPRDWAFGFGYWDEFADNNDLLFQHWCFGLIDLMRFSFK